MRISVVVPTCDRPTLLGEALASVFGQSLKPAETLVVDDGILPLAPLPFGVCAMRTTGRLGASSARNLGAEAATGDYLAFLDDDDWWAPSYLEEAAERLRAGADVVLTAFLKERRIEDTWVTVPEKTPPEALSPQDFFVRNPGLRGSNIVIRRSLFLAIGGFDPRLASHNDLDFGIRLFRHAGLVYRQNPSPLVHFRVHDGSRLSTAGSTANVSGARAFLLKHRDAMGAADAARFRERTEKLFGFDPGQALDSGE